MKVFLLLSFAFLAATCSAQFYCSPSPPKDLRITGLHAHSISIEFEDPEDLQRCPIGSYHTEIEQVVTQEVSSIGLAEYIPTSRTHSHNFLLLHSDTVYKISVTSISTHDVFSKPATIEAETPQQ